jgi:hypothetical protein
MLPYRLDDARAVRETNICFLQLSRFIGVYLRGTRPDVYCSPSRPSVIVSTITSSTIEVMTTNL